MNFTVARLKKIVHWLVAWWAYWRYGRPGRQLIVIGVTGTKGKTTTSRLIATALEAGGHKIGLLNTVEFQIGDQHIANKNQMSMLGRGQIQRYLRTMVQAGCRYAVIETSSEGILQYRHLGLCYDIAVFTNLGTEHHERHGGFEKLKADKGKLFAALARAPCKKIAGRKIPKVIIVNADAEHANFYLNFRADKKISFGVNPASKPSQANEHFIATHITSTSEQLTFNVNNEPYALALRGDFNVYNALPAIIIGRGEGIPANAVAKALRGLSHVAGRMEYIDAGQSFSFIVDYAHEPMSLTALFTALRPFVKLPGKLIGVIGSDGGGRDVTKRKVMGEIAGRLCDFVVITDVNPWDEDPHKIAEMLASGARAAGKIDQQNLFITIDRRAAMEQACQLAGTGGIVAITAKGTESSIIVAGGQRLSWDDRAVAREVLQKFIAKK